MASSEHPEGGTAETSMMWPHSLPRRVLQDAKSGVLELDVQPDEDDNMMNMGTVAALPSAPLIAACKLTASSRVSCLVASEALRSLFMFEGLRSLQLRFDCCSTPITDRMVAAIAELMLLTRLTLLRGSLLPEADLGHWTSLRNLQELVLLPTEQGGLRDAQLEQLTLLTPCLTSLTVRPHPDHITSAGRWHVASLTNLQQLSISPLAAAAAPAAAAAGAGESPDVSGNAAAAAAAAAAGAAGSGGLTGPRDAQGLLQCTGSGRASDSGGGCGRQPLDGHELSVLELQRLVELPGLTRLQLGLTHPQQVLLFSDVKLPKRPLDLLLTLHQCHPSSSDSLSPSPSRPCSPRATSPAAAAASSAADVLSVLSWSLTQQLVSLSLGPLAVASPNDVLLMVATLGRLQRLELDVLAAPDQHSSGTLDLLVLRPLSRLRRLALHTSARLYVPLTVKTVSLCALAWPELQSLSLSLAGKPELMPESLALCDNFSRLQQLELLSPLEDLECCSSSLQGTPTAAAAGQQQGLWRGGSSSWTEWAVTGLEGLGLASSSSAPATALNAAAVAAAAAEGKRPGPGSSSSPLHSGTRHTPSALAAAAGSPAAVSSPLAQDVRQQQLVHQHHQHHNSRLPGQLRVVPGSSGARNAAAIAAAAGSSGRGSSDYSRLLASANVGHLSRTGSEGFAAGGAAATGRLGRQQSLDIHQHHQQQQQQGGWSPKLLQGWLPSFGAAAAADGRAPAHAQLDCVHGGLVARSSSSSSHAAGGGGAWTRMLEACQGGSYAPGSPSAGLLSSRSITVCSPAHQQQLRRYSSSGWPATGSGSLASTPRAAGGSAAAAAPPGAVMAMHRAAARMVPVNLRYLPQGLQELSLESCHLLLASTAAASNSGSSKPESNGAAVPEQAAAQAAHSRAGPGQQEQEQGSPGSSQQQWTAEADATAASEQPPAAAEPPDSQPASAGVASLNAGPLGSSSSSNGSSSGSLHAATPGGANPGSSGGGSSSSKAVLDPRVLPHLQRLRLSGCLVDDATLAALITSCTALRSLQLSGIEGLTDAGLSGLPSLCHLTRLHIEAEQAPGVSLASLSSISRLTALKQLHMCSRDSLHGPVDPDRLAAQLCALTGLHQLLLETAPGSGLDMAGWKVVLQRRLPLCRLLTSPLELLLEEGDEQSAAGANGVWGDGE